MRYRHFASLAFALLFPVSVFAAPTQDAIKLLRAGQYEAANAAFTRQARQGDAVAMYYLGQSQIRGRGTGRDVDSGLDILTEAYAMPSEARGKIAYEIGRVYQALKSHRDYKKAHDWFWLSLENGYGKGHVQLYELNHRGLGAKTNKKQALHHLERAAKLKYPQSMIAFARHLQAGDYGTVDKREVAIWATKAIKILERQSRKGSSTASVRLGRLYLAGDIVAVDEKKARKWLKRGRKQGSVLARRYLKKIGEH